MPAVIPTERARVTDCTELSYNATKSSIYLPSPTAPSGFVLFFVSVFFKISFRHDFCVAEVNVCAQALINELCVFSTGR